MMRTSHPSGRPIRRERKVGRSIPNYPADPGLVYATPRLRPSSRSTVDAIAYKVVEPVEIEGIGFVRFGSRR